MYNSLFLRAQREMSSVALYAYRLSFFVTIFSTQYSPFANMNFGNRRGLPLSTKKVLEEKVWVSLNFPRAIMPFEHPSYRHCFGVEPRSRFRHRSPIASILWECINRLRPGSIPATSNSLVALRTSFLIRDRFSISLAVHGDGMRWRLMNRNASCQDTIGGVG